MQTLRKILSPLLLVISIPYAIIVIIRNLFYDWAWFKSTKFNLPIISVGNITVGGTGKTPHTEYLIELLKSKYKLATLSRGYKRKTTGFVLANKKSTDLEIGDEPMQMHQKFPDITVAVDEKRVHGVQNLIENKNPEIIILDDAYQHRKIKPGFSILLMDYSRPIYKDFFLPLGNLRETSRGKKRAQSIIVSKCPEQITDTERKKIINRLKPSKEQSIFFSTFEYGKPKLIYSQKQNNIKSTDLSILLVTGIANTKPLEKYLKENYSTEIKHLAYPDHYDFSENDLLKISNEFDQIDNQNKVIFTTEKDAIRLQKFSNIANNLANQFYFIPIKVKFLFNQEEEFNTQIINYVGEN